MVKSDRQSLGKKEKKVAKKSTTVASVDSSVEVFAKAKHVRVSPKKLRKIANLVRGKSVSSSLPVLAALAHKGSGVLLKVLQSAAANATNNNKFVKEALVISTVLVNDGMRFSRYVPRARGRIYPVMKRTSHIVVGVREKGVLK